MKWAIFMVLALAVSGCQTQGGTGGEVAASEAGQSRGTYVFPEGARYNGQLKDGKPHGYGTTVGRNGVRYTGQYKNGLKHGQGTYDFGQQGLVYKGQFRNDRMHGVGTCSLFGGKPYTCRCNMGNCE